VSIVLTPSMGRRGSTVLFIHGAHHAGWCWLLVMERLANCGIHARAIDLPFTAYSDDVHCVRAAIAAARSFGPVHVVCHSYAGLPVSEGGHAADHLTYVAARLPLPGESPGAITHKWGFAKFHACVQSDRDGVARLTPAARRHLYNRTDPTLAEFAMDRLRPMTSAVPDEPLEDPAWTSVPSSYVVCGDDRAVRPAAQRRRAALVTASVELDSDHSPFFSDPSALAAFIAGRHEQMVAGSARQL
jgi:Alpha/beta hydrolase family